MNRGKLLAQFQKMKYESKAFENTKSIRKPKKMPF
jgi:hypothetical protein